MDIRKYRIHGRRSSTFSNFERCIIQCYALDMFSILNGIHDLLEKDAEIFNRPEYILALSDTIDTMLEEVFCKLKHA